MLKLGGGGAASTGGRVRGGTESSLLVTSETGNQINEGCCEARSKLCRFTDVLLGSFTDSQFLFSCRII